MTHKIYFSFFEDTVDFFWLSFVGFPQQQQNVVTVVVSALGVLMLSIFPHE